MLMSPHRSVKQLLWSGLDHCRLLVVYTQAKGRKEHVCWLMENSWPASLSWAECDFPRIIRTFKISSGSASWPNGLRGHHRNTPNLINCSKDRQHTKHSDMGPLKSWALSSHTDEHKRFDRLMQKHVIANAIVGMSYWPLFTFTS